MAVEKTVKKENGFINKVDWLDLGMKFGSVVATAYLSGYVSSMANEHRQGNRVRKLASRKDSNVLVMPELKQA